MNVIEEPLEEYQIAHVCREALKALQNPKTESFDDAIFHDKDELATDVHGREEFGDARKWERERMIDLHGLHVSEAIHVLKRELSVLRNAARLANQRLLVYICVGTGHHTKGSRTPARLPTAVQRYLLEEEGLDFSEPQPGLLRVVIN